MNACEWDVAETKYTLHYVYEACIVPVCLNIIQSERRLYNNSCTRNKIIHIYILITYRIQSVRYVNI